MPESEVADNTTGQAPLLRSGRWLTGWLVAGAVAGALAGAAAGAIDGLWSWRDMNQFLPGPSGKLRALVYLAASYGLAGALAGAAGAASIGFFWHFTHVGGLFRHALARHRAMRAADPGRALAGLALTIAGIPCVAAALGVAYFYGVAALSSRKHMGLIIASAMGLGLAALLAGLLASFAVGRAVEVGLRMLARTQVMARILSSPRAPALAAVALMTGFGTAAVLWSWKTLSLLPLRPMWIVIGAAFLAVPATAQGRAVAARITGPASNLRPALRAALPVSVFALAIAVIAIAGAPDSVRKAAGQYSGLGGPLTRTLRTLADFDRDGHSRILGGGDCNDWNAQIHPGFPEIPDDGVDQNCVGGDATLARSTDEVGFVPVPDSVPADFNVLLITIDTLRADHVGAYGYTRPTTPNIDAVARSGALFVNGWAHAPSTRYSIPAILTGRYPLAVHYDTSIRGWPGLADKNTTIAELMKTAGMTTGAILNYWYFDRQRRMNQGFDFYDNKNRRLHKSIPGKGPAETRGSSSKEQTDKALAFVAKHADKRFFLWVHYYDPHFEYEVHREVPSFGSGTIDRYDNEIRFADLHIGRLLADLDKRGLNKRTVVVITGDHGEGFGEHGIDLHGYHLYAAQTKVPLIIRVPGQTPVEVTRPAGHIDILPTLANLARLQPTAEMMGVSLLDVMTGAADPHADRWVFQQLSYENNNEMRAGASKQCHVIYNVSPDTSWELYRIDRDPLEARDVIDDPGPCSQARAVLEVWYDRSEMPAGAAEALLEAPPVVADPLDLWFGSEVRVLEVDLPETPVRPGASFLMTLTFEAGDPLDGNWKLFVHFEGPGRSRFQGDHAPPRPFAWWRAGQYFRHDHTVTVPRDQPPGTYQVWMGLFRKSERRPATSSSIAIRNARANVGAIQVVR
ncbi:MAG: sulfatase-like hydrolase/transferase [Proteobacteria bacterium]|nr:sulfatase-like hydrolase/transferase [Pseudomonadota bacterium]